MKYLFCIVFVALGSNANRLPVEITDDLLQVKSIQLVQQLYPVNFYNIQLLSSVRETEPTYEFAAGFNYLKMDSGSCVGVAAQADSHSCSDIKTCVIEADSIELPNCELRTAGQQMKAAVLKMRLKKKPFVLARSCDRNRQCTVKWYKR